MNKRKSLGQFRNLEISPLVFGGNVIGWTVDESTTFALLDAFVAAGFNAIDTADMYSKWVAGHVGGESETILGNWMRSRGNRDKVIIATKVGLEMGPGQKGLSRSYILRSAENSPATPANRLHRPVSVAHRRSGHARSSETLGAYAELIAQGKVLTAIGASNYTGERLAAALEGQQKDAGLPKYQSLPAKLHTFMTARILNRQLEPVCLKEGLGVINYFPLGGGFLSGKYRSEKDMNDRPRARNVKKYLNDRGFKILDALDEVAQHHIMRRPRGFRWRG